jgi:uncharacterized protein YecE (DUF72 family)
MARYHIGTSGWNYKHWRERFYPKGLPQRRWLEFYSEHFDTVEINNSFYREPAEKTYEHWREQAPDGFCYAVKAHRFLTHRKRLHEPEDPLERVIKGARRLEDHLGPILYQLPPQFHRTDDNVARLDAFMELLPRDLLHVVEFRHKSWWETQDTLEQLRAHGVAFCTHDMGGAEMPLEATARFAYLRFHGPAGKYRGDYPDSLLRSWARRIEGLATDVDSVWVYFNNDIGGHAITNAQTLREMLGVREAAFAAAH